MQTPVGFIGLGTIGLPMAQRLLEQGMPLAVWNRTAEKAEGLVARGARRFASPRALVERCDVIITMVSDDAALREVVQGSNGIASRISSSKVHLDMGTTHPATTDEMEALYTGRGSQFVHAPVLGNKRHAASGELLIFAGGAPAAREKCQPIFAALGRRVWTWDEPRKATCVKLACNLLLGGITELLAESLLLTQKAGVAPDTLLDIIGMSALAAPMFQGKGQAMVQHDFTPSFYLRHMLKDLRFATGAAEYVGTSLPAARAICDVYAGASESGYADQDYSAILEWLEKQEVKKK